MSSRCPLASVSRIVGLRTSITNAQPCNYFLNHQTVLNKWFSTFLMIWPFNSFSFCSTLQPIKWFSLLLANYNFAIVKNCNVAALERQRQVGSRPTLSTDRVPRQPRLHTETLQWGMKHNVKYLMCNVCERVIWPQRGRNLQVENFCFNSYKSITYPSTTMKINIHSQVWCRVHLITALTKQKQGK